ncbi:unnamed protein product, partial [Closterium sp. Naga37s-1]
MVAFVFPPLPFLLLFPSFPLPFPFPFPFRFPCTLTLFPFLLNIAFTFRFTFPTFSFPPTSLPLHLPFPVSIPVHHPLPLHNAAVSIILVCRVSFTPFEDPVCSPEGHVYDIVNIVPYIQKFKRNPVTGKPLALKDLIKLHFHKNADGEYHCPVLKKVFTEFTHIVAVKTTGNVFCYEAIRELNVKPKNWKELLTDKPFTRADIITIQDPNNLDANVLTEFDHVKQNLAAPKEGEGSAAASGVNAAVSESIQRVLAALPKNDGEEPGVGSSKGASQLLMGGGGSKARKEAAAAAAALDARKAEEVAAAAAAAAREALAAQEGEEGAEQGGGGGAEGTGGAGGAGAGGKGKGGGEKAKRKRGEQREAEQQKKHVQQQILQRQREMEAPSIAGSAATAAGAAGTAGAAGAAGGGTGAPPPMSIVDAASAALSGRSAAAAKATDEKKAHARAAAHAAGQRVLIKENTKLVRSAYTSGATTRSFTSTVYEPVTTTEFEMVRVEKKPKKKGYCRVHTSAGDLNVELHCDIAPRTNFMIQGGDPTGTGKGGQSAWGKPFQDEFDSRLGHSERGVLSMANSGPHSNGSHSLERSQNFMIQGGDPTGTGKGGQSAWGKPFQDEFDSRLGHSERGVLSMANSGPHSNGSQFFVLFKSAPHLNYKHSVFGRVVGGMETLTALERSAVDDKDMPLKPITIESISVFVNPYTEIDAEAEAEEAAAREKEERKGKEPTWEEQQEMDAVGSWYSNPLAGKEAPKVFKSQGIGKYLNPSVAKPSEGSGSGSKAMGPPPVPVKKAQPSSYGNFDACRSQAPPSYPLPWDDVSRPATWPAPASAGPNGAAGRGMRAGGRDGAEAGSAGMGGGMGGGMGRGMGGAMGGAMGGGMGAMAGAMGMDAGARGGADYSMSDPIWAAIRAEARLEAEREPILSSFLYASILAHSCFERSIGFVLANRLQNVTLLATQLMDVFDSVLMLPNIRAAIRADVQAVRDRDPSCRSYSNALLYYKGYHALQSYRIAHALWNRGQRILALALQLAYP